MFHNNINIENEIQELGPWFHNIHLPGGVQTAPQHFLGDFPSFKWQEIAPHIPEDLSGWTALDIGCNAGYYTLELAKRGASVRGIDLDEHYLKQARWAAQKFNLEESVDFKRMQVYDLAKEEEKYDIVWFMGVFYHLRYPLLALDIIARRVNKLLIFQTLTMPGMDETSAPYDMEINDREQMQDPGWPKMAFIENRLAKDPTNWWAPNHAGIKAMLRTCGLEVIAQPGHEMYVCRPNPAIASDCSHWNNSEYLSAIGKEWELEALEKVKNKE